MVRAGQTKDLTIATRPLVLWTKRGLELLWLLTVVLVPLAFLGRDYVLSELELAFVDVPKTALLRTLAALMAMLWLLEWALEGRVPRWSFPKGSQLSPKRWVANLEIWLRCRPTRWLTLAVVIYLGSTLLSTAMSASFNVSMWGLVPGQDTYPAYTIIAYLILFGVISTHLQTGAQLWRLLAAIVVMGVLVGGFAITQHYGHDLFGLMEQHILREQRTFQNPSTSTMGNNILAGAVLLMTIPISLLVAIATLAEPPTSRRFWLRAILWSLLLAVQLLGIIFTSSRGPWIGTIAALIGFFGLSAIFIDRRTIARSAFVLGLAAVVTVIVLWGPPRLGPPRLTEEDASVASKPSTVLTQPRPEFTFPVSEASRVADRLTSVNREVIGGGFSSRLEIWNVARRLSLDHPWVGFDSLSIPYLRPLIGYGPDLFKYSYLLERRPSGEVNLRLTSNRFAHNYFIHKWVELGLIGLLAVLSIFVALILVGCYQLLRPGETYSLLHKLVLVGLLATLAGRVLEQMVGVAAVSDLTLSWILLGVFASLPAIMRSPEVAPVPKPSPFQERRFHRSHSLAGRTFGESQIFWRLALVACLAVGIGVLTWVKTISYPWAAVEARAGLEKINNGDFQGALSSLGRAIELAPDVPVYHNLRATVYSAYRDDGQVPRELECGRLGDTRAYQVCLARKVYLNNREGSEKRPFDWRRRLALAQSAQSLASLERDTDLAEEAVRLHREIAELDPQAWWSWEGLAAAYIQDGQPEAALPAVQKALTILKGTKRSANSHLLRGMAYRAMGQSQMALNSFDEAIRLNDKDYLYHAYANRGAAYNDLGQYGKAIQDLNEAMVNPKIQALAFTNRGNSYGNLDQLDRAIEDYSEAIRVDPRFALAYYNRALAYTLLGRDSEAQIDLDQATSMGLDTTPLLSKIQEVKKAR